METNNKTYGTRLFSSTRGRADRHRISRFYDIFGGVGADHTNPMEYR